MRFAVVTSVLLGFFACPTAWAGDSAEDILKATGVKGGLVVQVGCGDGKLTAALLASDSFLVQGLDSDPANVERARTHIRSLGLAEKISIRLFDGERLPYVDNLVNLILVSGAGCRVSNEEIERVLSPGGVAVSLDPETRKLKSETLVRRPWPADVDEWTHYLHGPGNNAVAQDSVVGPPQHFQWISKPRFSRSHDHLASMSAIVSAGGRLFCIVDEGSIAFAGASPRWRLVARDAFNGVRLWQRSISKWEYHLRDFRSGPADIARRLVAIGDRVYVTLGYGQPVVALDAATGETVRTYADTEGTREILCHDGTLLLVLGVPKEGWQAEKAKQIVSQPQYSPPFERYTPPAHEMQVMAVDADTGKRIWRNSQPYMRQLLPSTLAASADGVYLQNTDAVICLDRATGEMRWKTPRAAQRKRLAWSTPTLVVHDGVVYSADRRAADAEGDVLWIPSGGYHEYIRGEDVKGELIALSAETGERLWSCPAFEGFNAPVDVMITGGLLWTGRYAWGNDPGITEARDPKTGEVRRQRPSDREFLPRIGHARCHRAKATTSHLILGRRGVEFVDLDTGDMVANFWVRGMCQYGVMPANGLLYVPPHSCACSVNDMLKCGLMALAPARKTKEVQRTKDEGQSEAGRPRLVKGLAYGELGTQNSERGTDNPGDAPGDVQRSEPIVPHSAFRTPRSTDWPTYRHDSSRSGVTSADVSPKLHVAWEADLGGKLTSPVIAGGVVLVAQTNTHCVHALDAATGHAIWTFVAGARIDSPPTIDRGRALFGSADGCVYCLRLSDGELIWQFRAAPLESQIVANGQLESPWPVSGSVLVADGAAYFVAGRTSYLDGGMYLYKLDAATGQVLGVERLEVERQRRDGGIASGGHLPDVLSTDVDSIFLRSARFDENLVRQKDTVPHLWSSVGFLDDSWWHRTYWQFGTSMSSGWGGWAKAGQKVPAGRLLATDGARVFGFGRNQYDTPGAHVGVDADGVWGPIGRQQGRWTFYRLFKRTLGAPTGNSPSPTAEKPAGSESQWARRVPVLGQALVLAGETLFLAGPSDPVSEIPREPAGVDPLAEALETNSGGRLLAVSAADGKTLADHKLTSPPVFDGMAAAGGRLYLSTKIGKVVCMGPER